MSKGDFDKFVKRQKTRAAAAGKLDANAMREQWLANVEALYKRVEAILRDYVARGDIAISYKPHEIDEETLGSYQTRLMSIKIGSQIVQLVPIGAAIIGASGRVDLQGPRGTEKLILVEKATKAPAIRITVRDENGRRREPVATPREDELTWKLATPPPSISYIELTSDSLMEAIMGVADA
jgi:hypothetical protein